MTLPTSEQRAIIVGTLNYLIRSHSAEIAGISSRLRLIAGNIPDQDVSIWPIHVERQATGARSPSMPGLSVSEIAQMQSLTERLSSHRMILMDLVRNKLAILGDPDTPGGDIILADIMELSGDVPDARCG